MQKLQLYKVRDFGAKINATIEYIRENIVSLLKVVLLIVVPLGLLMGIFFSSMFSTIFQASLNPEMSGADGMSFMADLGVNYLLMMLLSMVTGAFMIGSVYAYMRLNDKSENPPSPLEVIKKVAVKIPQLIVLMILIGIVSGIGMMFFVLPGIYLGVTLSLALPIFIFEDLGIGKSFSKSFQLIKGKWWSTFGLLLITGIIASIVSYLFAIPFYIGLFGDAFMTASITGGDDPAAVFEAFSSWYMVVGMGIMMIGSYVTYLIPLIALSFQYFNLSERIEGRGILGQINEFETAS